MNPLNYNYIIIEDDIAIWDNLKRRMSHYTDWKFAGATDDFDEAIELIKKESPLLIFLDWSIKNGNAYGILNYIKSIESYNPYVIFFTGYQSEHPEIPQEIMNNYSVVKKYIIKPIYENLSANLFLYLEEAIQNFDASQKNPHIFIEDQFKQKIKINPQNIIAIIQCTTNPRNKIIHLNGSSAVEVKYTMSELITLFHPYSIDFFISNKRKSIVNKRFITKIIKPYLILNESLKIEVARENWNKLEL